MALRAQQQLRREYLRYPWARCRSLPTILEIALAFDECFNARQRHRHERSHSFCSSFQPYNVPSGSPVTFNVTINTNSLGNAPAELSPSCPVVLPSQMPAILLLSAAPAAWATFNRPLRRSLLHLERRLLPQHCRSGRQYHCAI